MAEPAWLLLFVVATGDAFDGQLARWSGHASRAGDVADAAMDKVFPSILILGVLERGGLLSILGVTAILGMALELVLLVWFSHRHGAGPRSTTLAKTSAMVAFLASLYVSLDVGASGTGVLLVSTALIVWRGVEMNRFLRMRYPDLQPRTRRTRK